MIRFSTLGTWSTDPILRLADQILALFRDTRVIEHLLDAVDLMTAAGRTREAARLLGDAFVRPEYRIDRVRDRMAGLRAMIRLGDGFAACLLNIGAVVGPSQDDIFRKLGVLVRINGLTDSPIVPTGFDLENLRLENVVTRLWGPLGFELVALGNTLAKRAFDPETRSRVEPKLRLLGCFLRPWFGELYGNASPNDLRPIMPPGDREVAAWATQFLQRARVERGAASEAMFVAVGKLTAERSIHAAADVMSTHLDAHAEDAPGWSYLAELYSAQITRLLNEQQTKAAIPLIRRSDEYARNALALDPLDVPAHLHLGWLAADIVQRPDDARQIFQLVLDRASPYHPDALRCRGVLRHRAGDAGGSEDLALAQAIAAVAP